MVDGKENSSTDSVSTLCDIPDANNNVAAIKSTTSRIAEKYGLRPRTIVKRIQLVERTRRQQETASREPRKPKPPPLSKYRRKTANARERHRMKEINEAFATLRGILPAFSTRRPTSSGMTKITTLKMAANYIKTLADVLQEVEPSNAMSSQVTQPMLMDEKQNSASHLVSYLGYRESVSSNSELGDLLSDDSCMLEDHLEAFDDIPALSEPDPFALLLADDHQLDVQ